MVLVVLCPCACLVAVVLPLLGLPALDGTYSRVGLNLFFNGMKTPVSQTYRPIVRCDDQLNSALRPHRRVSLEHLQTGETWLTIITPVMGTEERIIELITPKKRNLPKLIAWVFASNKPAGEISASILPFEIIHRPSMETLRVCPSHSDGFSALRFQSFTE